MSRKELLNTFQTNKQVSPDKVIFSDADISLSWDELYFLALNISYALSSSEKQYIPVIVNRSVYTPCVFLGCMLAGKTFIPISDKQPVSRISDILTQIEHDVVIDLSSKNKIPNNVITRVIDLQECCELARETANKKTNENDRTPKYDDSPELVYILFTSGSTGKPKGVKLTYKNILNTIHWSSDYLLWEDNDIIGNATNFAFDISLFDIFTSLYFSVPCHIIEDSIDPFKAVDIIKQNTITSIFSSPALFCSFAKSNLLKSLRSSRLRQIISGGDFFVIEHLKQWQTELPDIRILNVWGPTETSIVNTMHEVSTTDIEIAEEKN